MKNAVTCYLDISFLKIMQFCAQKFIDFLCAFFWKFDSFELICSFELSASKNQIKSQFAWVSTQNCTLNSLWAILHIMSMSNTNNINEKRLGFDLFKIN